MKNIMTIATTVACAFALTACGGGSSSGTASSLAAEGIWSNFSSVDTPNYGMQAVILNDGSYWGIYGWVDGLTGLTVNGFLHGIASTSGSSISGTYTDGYSNGTYARTVSAQNNLNLTFNDPSNNYFTPSIAGVNFDLSYDSIYNQPASLSAIAGNYLGGVPGTTVPPPSSPPPDEYDYSIYSLAISGSNLALDDQNGKTIMTGTIAPHGTAVNVFDVSLTAAATVVIEPFTGNVSTGTVYKGILFQTSSGILENKIEMIITAGNSAFFYLGSK